MSIIPTCCDLRRYILTYEWLGAHRTSHFHHHPFGRTFPMECLRTQARTPAGGSRLTSSRSRQYFLFHHRLRVSTTQAAGLPFPRQIDANLHLFGGKVEAGAGTKERYRSNVFCANVNISCELAWRHQHPAGFDLPRRQLFVNTRS